MGRDYATARGRIRDLSLLQFFVPDLLELLLVVGLQVGFAAGYPALVDEVHQRTVHGLHTDRAAALDRGP